MPDIFSNLEITLTDVLEEKDKIKTRKEFSNSLSAPQIAYILDLRIQAVNSAEYWLNDFKKTNNKKSLEKIEHYLTQARTIQFLIDLNVHFEKYKVIENEYNKIKKRDISAVDTYGDNGEFAASLTLMQDSFLQLTMDDFIDNASHLLDLYKKDKDERYFELVRKYFYHAMAINYLINSYNNDKYKEFYYEFDKALRKKDK